MRVLAIDHGTKRMGIAISDELKVIAQPLEYIEAEPVAPFYERLGQLLRDRDVDLIVVGMPRNMDGSYGPAAEKVRAFVEQLKSVVSVPVRLWDERLTSVQANRLLQEAHVRGAKRRQVVDKMAAAVLLQSYLDATGEA